MITDILTIIHVAVIVMQAIIKKAMLVLSAQTTEHLLLVPPVSRNVMSQHFPTPLVQGLTRAIVIIRNKVFAALTTLIYWILGSSPRMTHRSRALRDDIKRPGSWGQAPG